MAHSNIRKTKASGKPLLTDELIQGPLAHAKHVLLKLGHTESKVHAFEKRCSVIRYKSGFYRARYHSTGEKHVPLRTMLFVCVRELFFQIYEYRRAIARGDFAAATRAAYEIGIVQATIFDRHGQLDAGKKGARNAVKTKAALKKEILAEIAATRKTMTRLNQPSPKPEAVYDEVMRSRKERGLPTRSRSWSYDAERDISK
jgi:hypothetical protein